MAIEEFHTEFFQDILARAGSEKDFSRSVFVDYMCSFLEEQGEFNGYSQVDYKNTARGYAIDAWAFDEELGNLVLIVADFRESGTLENLTKTELEGAFRRAARFYEASRKVEVATALDEAMPVTELAWLIAGSHGQIKRITLVLVSNAQLSTRVEALPDQKVGGLPTAYEAWDFSRIYRLESSGREREDVEIDLTTVVPDGLLCLPAFAGADDIRSYLLVLPGGTLADLYETYGERLLEQNVRTFLQFRGKVNKGIRNTIIQEPKMFFSYNNGISATAEEVQLSKDGSRILRIKNLQIVNGGQTTASVFTARRKESAELKDVYVQVKLSVVPGDRVNDIVPRISEYANTQNKVSAADFFSNHPFHLRIEEFSRRLWAPSREGGVQETHWFYERARGQYANQQANLTPARKKGFLLQNPRSQMFTKTDLAKFVLSFEEEPHVVSLGAQKAFAGGPRVKGFVSRIAQEWEKNETSFNEHWFKTTIAKAILFRGLDKAILSQPWYSGYKANIVTYTLAKFTCMVRNKKKCIDFMKIWQDQELPPALQDQLLQIAEAVNGLLHSPPEDLKKSNISEWAKLEICWDQVKDHPLPLNSSIAKFLADPQSVAIQEREGIRTQNIQDGIHVQTYVVEKGSGYWAQLSEWNNVQRKLTPMESNILSIACNPQKVLSEKQAAVLVRAEKRAIEEGFFNNGAS